MTGDVPIQRLYGLDIPIPSTAKWNAEQCSNIRNQGDAIVHVHGKDVYVDPLNMTTNGCNDHKAYGEIPGRAWTFRTIGYGHDVKVWKHIISALRLIIIAARRSPPRDL
jgi:sugar phosphate isomerase/epimerase